MSWDIEKFDINHHHHHHFICSEQATQHMTANANEQDQKAQRAV